MYRDAAVFLEDAVDVTISGCSFLRVDGNGVMLSGTTRIVRIVDSDFMFIGDSAMVTWGRTDAVFT